MITPEESQDQATQDVKILTPETVSSAPVASVATPETVRVRSFEEAKEYVFANFDNGLRRLAEWERRELEGSDPS